MSFTLLNKPLEIYKLRSMKRDAISKQQINSLKEVTLKRKINQKFN